jgi:glycosyltransferase involved in cell wall biosynthesis
MSVLNEERYVKDAIESILNQTYEDFELLIINDYSTDRSLEVCEGFRDPRIRIYSKTDEHSNLACSRNIGVRLARGNYIMLQDADDTSEPTRIEKQITKAMENPGRRIVGCSVNRVENGVERIILYPETHERICAGFLRTYNRATIVLGTILAPKWVFEKFPYRVRFKYGQDWDHTLRMYESGRLEFYNCQEPLYTYNIRPKCVIFNPEWFDYNIFVRNCQTRRKKGLEEFINLKDFLTYLDKHPLERWKWLSLKKLIELNLRIKRGKQARQVARRLFENILRRSITSD